MSNFLHNAIAHHLPFPLIGVIYFFFIIYTIIMFISEQPLMILYRNYNRNFLLGVLWPIIVKQFIKTFLFFSSEFRRLMGGFGQGRFCGGMFYWGWFCWEKFGPEFCFRFHIVLGRRRSSRGGGRTKVCPFQQIGASLWMKHPHFLLQQLPWLVQLQGVADNEAAEGVNIGDEGELVAKATEPVSGLNGKIIPVKGKIIGLAVPKGATAPAAKVAWWRAALFLFFNLLEGPRCFAFTCWCSWWWWVAPDARAFSIPRSSTNCRLGKPLFTVKWKEPQPDFLAQRWRTSSSFWCRNRILSWEKVDWSISR